MGQARHASRGLMPWLKKLFARVGKIPVFSISIDLPTFGKRQEAKDERCRCCGAEGDWLVVYSL